MRPPGWPFSPHMGVDRLAGTPGYTTWPAARTPTLLSHAAARQLVDVDHELGPRVAAWMFWPDPATVLPGPAERELLTGRAVRRQPKRRSSRKDHAA